MRPPQDLERDLLQVEREVRGLEVSEARRLKMLEAENSRRNKLLAEAMLDNAALKDLLGKTSEARDAETGDGQDDEGATG